MDRYKTCEAAESSPAPAEAKKKEKTSVHSDEKTPSTGIYCNFSVILIRVGLLESEEMVNFVNDAAKLRNSNPKFLGFAQRIRYSIFCKD